MANKVDDKINEIINEHAAESERLSVSRDVDETGRRIKAALEGFTKLDILASDHWGGLYYEAKILALREALLELAQPRIVDTAALADMKIEPGNIQVMDAAPAPKKPRKAKVAA